MRVRYGDETVRRWESMCTDPYKNDSGQWDSAFRSKNEGIEVGTLDYGAIC